MQFCQGYTLQVFINTYMRSIAEVVWKKSLKYQHQNMKDESYEATNSQKESSMFGYATDLLTSISQCYFFLTDIGSISNSSYPVFGEKDESNVSFSPLAN